MLSTNAMSWTCADVPERQSDHMVKDCPASRCHYCGREGHLARTCPMGTSNHPSLQFIPCESACFVRRFVVPLSRASASFDLEKLTEGRMDVGCRCITSALFRSQGLRQTTEIRLCLGAGLKSSQTAKARGECNGAAKEGEKAPEGVILTLSGGLIRELKPDEASVAGRLRFVIDKDMLPAPANRPDETAQKAKQRHVLEEKLGRGVRCFFGGLRHAVDDALVYRLTEEQTDLGKTGIDEVQCNEGTSARSGNEQGVHVAPNTAEGRIVVMKLAPDGVPIEKFLSSIKEQAMSVPIAEIITVVGDDRGLSTEDQDALDRVAEVHSVEVTSVSLGGAMLLASHCIVIVQHYMDVILHTCPSKLWAAPPKEVVQLRKKAQRRKKRRRRHTGEGDDNGKEIGKEASGDEDHDDQGEEGEGKEGEGEGGREEDVMDDSVEPSDTV